MNGMTIPVRKPVALITGASKGIGEKIALDLAARGYQLALCARSTEKLNVLSEKLSGVLPPSDFLMLPCDVQNAEAVARSVAHTKKQFGRIDVLINNAGIAPRVGLFQELSVEDIHQTLDTNLKGPLFFMRLVIPQLVEQGGGTIININSIAGKTAYPYWALYDASKFGLRALTEAVAEEQRVNNVKVVGIYPGAVDTAIWDNLQVDDNDVLRTGMLSVEDVSRAVLFILEQPPGVLIKELTISPVQNTV
jgi:NADP-dependent 3-hydroxy acid dehydrogenase YdfG